MATNMVEGAISVASAVNDAVTGAANGVAQSIRGYPRMPPPLLPPMPPPSFPPTEPPPVEPPPLMPLIVCPPSAPPPMSPPGFSTWSAHVPQWAWLTFAVIMMFACAGMAALVYVLRELRAQRRGHRLPREETLKALAHLEKRMQRIGTGSQA